MKRHFYLLGLLLLLFGATSCKKDDPEPEIPAVVGKWEIDYVIYSDFTGNYAGYNGRADPHHRFELEYTTKLYINNDTGKSYLESWKSANNSGDADGVWSFENNILKLTETGQTLSQDLTYSVVKGVEQLSTIFFPVQFLAEDESIVTGKMQFVFRR